MSILPKFSKARLGVVFSIGLLVVLAVVFAVIYLKSKPPEYRDRRIAISNEHQQFFIVKVVEVKEIGIVDVYYQKDNGKCELVFSGLKRSLYFKLNGNQNKSVDFFVYPAVNEEMKRIIDGIAFQTHFMDIPENSDGMIDSESFGEYVRKNNLQKITPW